jgi:hypothetical protein
MVDGPDERLRAVLPPLSPSMHGCSVRMFLESLALWTDSKLHVAASADGLGDSYSLGLTDGLGMGVRSVLFDVDLVEPKPRRPRPVRLQGVGDFRDVRQLLLQEVAP